MDTHLKSTFRRHVLLACAGVAFAGAPAWAADAYPSKPIRLVVPFAAGGPTDVVARMLAEKMGASLKQPVVVDNRGGAGGALGTDLVAKATPDGYTIGLATASTHEFSPACAKEPPYHPVKDFEMVGIIATTPSMLFVKSDSPYAGLKELLAASRKDPGKITWGTPGACSNTHFLVELVNRSGNGKIAPVPYRGNSQANTDLIGGVLTMGSDAVTPATIGLIRAGQIRPVALTSRSNIDLLKAVPTYAEQGVNIGAFTIWQGLVAPAKASPEVVRKLNASLRQALADPVLRSKWIEAGITPYPDNSPEKMRAHVQEGYDGSRKLAQELGITAN